VGHTPVRVQEYAVMNGGPDQSEETVAKLLSGFPSHRDLLSSRPSAPHPRIVAHSVTMGRSSLRLLAGGVIPPRTERAAPPRLCPLATTPRRFSARPDRDYRRQGSKRGPLPPYSLRCGPDFCKKLQAISALTRKPGSAISFTSSKGRSNQNDSQPGISGYGRPPSRDNCCPVRTTVLGSLVMEA